MHILCFAHILSLNLCKGPILQMTNREVKSKSRTIARQKSKADFKIKQRQQQQNNHDEKKKMPSHLKNEETESCGSLTCPRSVSLTCARVFLDCIPNIGIAGSQDIHTELYQSEGVIQVLLFRMNLRTGNILVTLQSFPDNLV